MKTVPAIRLSPHWSVKFGPVPEDWSQNIPSGTVDFSADGIFDLDQLHHGTRCEECVVYQTVRTSDDGVFCAGIGTDWWADVHCNGELIFSTMNTGNGGNQFAPENNPFLLPLRKGDNLLAIKLRRGVFSWAFICNGSAKMPPVAEVELGPWLCNPAPGHMEVRMLTGHDTGTGVEYRKAGDREWKTVWPMRNGQVLRGANHRVAIGGTPGGDYEYRVVMRDIRDPKTIIREEQTHSFRMPDPNSDRVSFLYTADLQFGLPKQRQYLEKMLDVLDFPGCDFFVFGGDIGEFSDIRRDLLDGAVKCLIDHGLSEKPLVFARGNHELRGLQSSLFADYFGLSGDKTYGIFRYGSTAFLVLDCWEDKPATSGADYTLYNDDAAFLQEEKDFLSDALRTPEWTQAKRRIVLAHGCCYSNMDSCGWQPFQLQRMTDEFFHGKTPESRLDLWLAGHSHIHLRSLPGTDLLAAPAEPPRPFRTGENDVYPVLTVGGPIRKYPVQASCYRVDVSAEKIRARACDQDGKILDDVEYFNDGTFRENLPVPHFHCPASDKKENPWLA